ncbi:LysR substrate-binding domain-containing protein [Massilia niastensis]|uniref:LysR substrate-binding domain-containing protein n=1 Tax=Massilia niastensis TaxID=544911 RepID=UPI00037050C1|nr:LysR substrate-binding domain-containing protein [Massilia niastensis]
MQFTSLPPLDALKGFVAAARRGSITAAAQDLCLTQSAVSRQIQSLEERLGTPLFVRGNRAIVLTEAGQQLYRLAGPWLEQLAGFAASLRAGPKARPVTVSASIGVAALWVLPRLGAFQALYPHVDVRLAASNQLHDLEREGIDLAIRYCSASQAPRVALHLFDEVVVPVASPGLAARAFRSRASLLGEVLLDLDDHGRSWLTWPGWLRERAFENPQPRGYLHFNQYDQVIQAALEGHGVALGRLALVEPMLRAGRLAALADETQRIPERAYWLLDAAGPARPEVALFRDWLLHESRLSRQSLA